jgi:hypothetical protein
VTTVIYLAERFYDRFALNSRASLVPTGLESYLFLAECLDSVGAGLAREGGLTGCEISGRSRRKFPSISIGFHELVRLGPHR